MQAIDNVFHHHKQPTPDTQRFETSKVVADQNLRETMSCPEHACSACDSRGMQAPPPHPFLLLNCNIFLTCNLLQTATHSLINVWSERQTETKRRTLSLTHTAKHTFACGRQFFFVLVSSYGMTRRSTRLFAFCLMTGSL